MKNKHYSIAFLLIIALAIFVVTGVVFGAWQGPSTSPPGGNVSAPLNVGPVGQQKIGGLLLASTSSITNGLLVQYGNVGIGTTNPGAKLDVQGQIIGGFGAVTTGGATDWNNSTNARSGSGYTLLLGSAANGPGPAVYYHPFSFEYSSKGGTGNMTQLAIPYYTDYPGYGSNLFIRSRYSGTWSLWKKILSEDINGNVGIGTVSPGYKLDVVSGGGTTARFGTASSDTVIIGGGNGKLSVGTIDPVYNINGEKFATYMAAMTGVKEETTGNVWLACNATKCVSMIDFDEQEKGSDLWLFWQITDFGSDWQNLVVLLTPEGRQDVWYEIDSLNHQLLIFGERPGRVSYRLTAPRFDHEKWLNINQDGDVEGMKVELKNK